MDVRPALIDDVSDIAQVHVAAWQVGYRGLLPQALLDGLHPDQRVARWISTIELADWPRRGTLVADDHGVVLGFADLGPTRDADQDPACVGEVASFYVAPDAWRHGIGRRLMIAAEDALQHAGYTMATLWVLGTNAGAMRFYEACGWSQDGTTKQDTVGDAVIVDRRYRLPLAQR